jgi:hypothetical protein
MTAVQAAILRDADLRPPGEGLRLRMRTESMETTRFTESIARLLKQAVAYGTPNPSPSESG